MMTKREKSLRARLNGFKHEGMGHGYGDMRE